MKIALASDLHLEFKTIELKNTDQADVLILAGDIFVASDFKKLYRDTDDNTVYVPSEAGSRALRYKEFLTNCSREFKHVILIMGNHEHYQGNFAETVPTIREAIQDLENIYFLDKQFTMINNVIFYGGTLWTDFNNDDPITVHTALFGMNDYQVVKNIIKGRYCKFLPADALEDHRAFLTELDKIIKVYPNQPTVIVGHHAPTKQSMHPRYQHEYHMNGCYSTDLTKIILDNPQIRVWVHGHTHDDFDYMVGTTRVLCNPRGYDGYEPRAQKFKLVTFEV